MYRVHLDEEGAVSDMWLWRSGTLEERQHLVRPPPPLLPLLPLRPRHATGPFADRAAARQYVCSDAQRASVLRLSLFCGAVVVGWCLAPQLKRDVSVPLWQQPWSSSGSSSGGSLGSVDQLSPPSGGVLAPCTWPVDHFYRATILQQAGLWTHDVMSLVSGSGGRAGRDGRGQERWASCGWAADCCWVGEGAGGRGRRGQLDAQRGSCRRAQGTAHGRRGRKGQPPRCHQDVTPARLRSARRTSRRPALSRATLRVRRAPCRCWPRWRRPR